MTLGMIAAQCGLSERMVRRYISKLGIDPSGIYGRSSTYPHSTLERVRQAVLDARAARSEAVRAAIARRTGSVQEKPDQVISVREAKARAKGGAR